MFLKTGGGLWLPSWQPKSSTLINSHMLQARGNVLSASNSAMAGTWSAVPQKWLKPSVQRPALPCLAKDLPAQSRISRVQSTMGEHNFHGESWLSQVRCERKGSHICGQASHPRIALSAIALSWTPERSSSSETKLPIWARPSGQIASHATSLPVPSSR